MEMLINAEYAAEKFFPRRPAPALRNSSRSTMEIPGLRAYCGNLNM